MLSAWMASDDANSILGIIKWYKKAQLLSLEEIISHLGYLYFIPSKLIYFMHPCQEIYVYIYIILSCVYVVQCYSYCSSTQKKQNTMFSNIILIEASFKSTTVVNNCGRWWGLLKPIKRCYLIVCHNGINCWFCLININLKFNSFWKNGYRSWQNHSNH